MFLMQVMKPEDERGEEAMANVLAVINKVSTNTGILVLQYHE